VIVEAVTTAIREARGEYDAGASKKEEAPAPAAEASAPTEVAAEAPAAG
jgi:hypothetical protein